MQDLASELTASICHHLEFYRRYERWVARRLGMRASDLRCLHEFHERSGFSVGELRRRLGLSQSQLSRALGRLEAADLVVRRIDPRNHRCVLADVTRQGSAIVQVLDTQLTDVYREALHRVPPESGVTGIAALRLLLACLPSPSDERSPARPAQPPAARGRRSP